MGSLRWKTEFIVLMKSPKENQSHIGLLKLAQKGRKKTALDYVKGKPLSEISEEQSKSFKSLQTSAGTNFWNAIHKG